MVVIGHKSIKEFVGKVTSAGMQKTIVVSVPTVKVHPLYKKRYTTYKKCYAHDENSCAKVWDIVRIRQCSPLSKTKRRMFVEVLTKTEDEVVK